MRFSLLLATVASAYLFVGINLAQRRRHSYSWRKHTISELGESGAHDSLYVSYLLFLPVGLVLISLACLNYFQGDVLLFSPSLAGLAFCVGIGYVVAAFFPCDPGSPTTGTLRQTVHNLGGFVEYVGGAYFINQADSPYLKYASVVILGGAVFISFGSQWRGAIQRVAETLLFAGIFVMSA